MAATTQRPSRWYSDRNAMRAFLGIDSTVTDKDAKIDIMIARASAYIEQKTDRRFIPWTGTKEFDYQGALELVFGDDLLSSTPTITHNDGVDTVAAGDYFLYPLNAADDNRPYLSLEMLYTDDFLFYNDTRQSAIAITGKWGYCEISWLSGSLLTAGITAAATTVPVDAGTDFSIGQTILIGTEQMWISNIATNNLTVTRGMNGTTAAIAANDAPVSILGAPDDIQMAVEILAARWLYRAESSWADTVGSADTRIHYSKALPEEVTSVIKRYRRLVGARHHSSANTDLVGGWAIEER